MIFVFGSSMLDLIGRVSRFPKPGETVPGSTFSSSPGGKGANQALAGRRAGAKVRLICATGNDDFSDGALVLLRAGGVDMSAVKVADAATGIAMIFVEESGDNEIAILPGANTTLSAADAETALAGLTAKDVVVVQQEVPQAATRRALELARQAGATSILNTAPFLDSTGEVAPLASIVVANETEFALLAGDGEREVLMAQWARDKRQTMIVTLGPDGAKAATPETSFSVPALPITPVDTVGAGDTFVGYLAAGLDAGLDLKAAMQRAAVAASLACLKQGAQPAIPMGNEVDRAAG